MATSKKATTVLTGVAALVSGLGATALGFASPAAAAAPTCDASKSDSAFQSVLDAANGSKLATYKKSAAYKKLPKAKQATALAAYVKKNLYVSTSGSNTPAAVKDLSGRGTTNSWGAYKVRAIFLNGKLTAVCTAVDESSVASAEDRNTSATTYQGIGQNINSADGYRTIPILTYAALYAPANNKTKILQNVTTCTTVEYTTKSNTVCPGGGLHDASVVGAGGVTGATYTVNGFKNSLQSALTKAKSKNWIA